MYASEGEDTFVWREGDFDDGTDTIIGFEFGTDKLRFEHLVSEETQGAGNT